MNVKLPQLPGAGSGDQDDHEPDDSYDPRLLEQFYTAAQALPSPAGTSTGSPALDTLLQKGLYGEKAPAALRSKKAAEAFQTAFDLIGGVPRLALWADRNPTAFYSLFSKLIPSSVKTDLTAKIVVEAPWMNPNRLSYKEQSQDVIDVDAVQQLSKND